MGMTCSLTTVSDRNIGLILEYPPLVYKITAPKYPEAFEAAVQEFCKRTLLDKVLGRKKPAKPGPGDLELSPGEGTRCFLEKSWHDLHTLLTGSDWKRNPPLDFLLAGGREIKIYADRPMRLLTSGEARAVHDALALLTDDQVRGRIRPQKVADNAITSELRSRNAAIGDAQSYLMEHLGILRRFLAKTVENRLGFVVDID